MPRIGLALAGGGPLGAIWEIGALCALEEALDGLAFAELDAYVGVSAGAFIAAGLANGMTPRDLCASFIENAGPEDDVVLPSALLRPAWREIARRASRLPRLAGGAALQDLLIDRSLSGAIERLAGALPAGLFSSEGIEAQLRRQFSAPGRSNDFRTLARKLVLVATDLDTGEPAPFGQPGWDHVPISRAVQASAALPGLFPPVEIEGRHYVDGVLKKTVHASVLLGEGMDLLLCLNPIVPFRARGSQAIPPLVEGGLPVVLSQTFRTMIHSRLELGMKGYGRSHPHTTLLLFEPEPGDVEVFLANTFGYAQRRVLAEHAYRQTRRQLRERAASLAPRLRRHGIGIRRDVLDDLSRTLLPPIPPVRAASVVRLERVLDELARALAAMAPRVQPGRSGKAHNRAPVMTR